MSLKAILCISFECEVYILIRMKTYCLFYMYFLVFQLGGSPFMKTKFSNEAMLLSFCQKKAERKIGKRLMRWDKMRVNVLKFLI